jgi:hypothetical protein
VIGWNDFRRPFRPNILDDRGGEVCKIASGYDRASDAQEGSEVVDEKLDPPDRRLAFNNFPLLNRRFRLSANSLTAMPGEIFAGRDFAH